MRWRFLLLTDIMRGIMQWLNTIVENIIKRFPDGEILVESGASPSGTYHVGHLRELITCDAIVLELTRRGHAAKHIHFVDDLDGLRKVPVNVPAEYDKYLGYPLCDIPAPDGSGGSYGDYFLKNFMRSVKELGVEAEIHYSHEKYRSGFFTPAIERSLDSIESVKSSLEAISHRKLDDHWSPIQILEDGRLKKRHFISIDTVSKTIIYSDAENNQKTAHYDRGEVKLDWRLDWPGRWWLLGVSAEPFGQDHASKGGSYDTGAQIVRDIYKSEPPVPIPYEFVNRAGDTKKMSASKGTGIDAVEVVKVLPAEVVRFFMLRHAPDKRLFFDQGEGVVRLMDEFAELAAKTNRTQLEETLYYVSTRGLPHRTVSRVPFSHLVASYQASLKDSKKTLQAIYRTEHRENAEEDAAIIVNELRFIDEWLKRWAPEDVKFELLNEPDFTTLSAPQREYLALLADKISLAPDNADGAWFHATIYSLKGEIKGLEPKELFQTLYTVLIGKSSGPRAGWFLSILPRDWLVSRLKMEK